jgi:hypothetical protein
VTEFRISGYELSGLKVAPASVKRRMTGKHRDVFAIKVKQKNEN